MGHLMLPNTVHKFVLSYTSLASQLTTTRIQPLLQEILLEKILLETKTFPKEKSSSLEPHGVPKLLPAEIVTLSLFLHLNQPN